MSFLGIDFGSTSIKAGWLDRDAQTVCHVRSRPFPAPVPDLPPSWFEVEPGAIVDQARSLLEEMLSSGERCEGIVACSQMGGVILADDDGRAVTNFFSWRDQRTLDAYPGGAGSYLDELRRRTTPDDWKCIGHELKPGAAASLLYWLAETNAIPAAATQAMSLGEYVISQFSNSPAKAEPTLALSTLNLATGSWHTDWFERLGFGQLRWPPMCPYNQPVGEIRVGDRAIPVFPAIGDHQAALLGTSLTEGELSVNVSTGSQVALLAPAWQPGAYQSRPYFGQYLNTITHLPAGRSLNALVDLLSELPKAEGVALRDPWAIIAREVERTPATDLDVHLAFFSSAVGEWGHIVNIRLEDLTIGSLFRAAFEHMAANYLACAELLSPDRAWNRIVLSGGLPQKIPALRDTILERFGGPHRMVDTPEETLHGLLQLADRIAR